MFQFLWPIIQWAGGRILLVVASIDDPYLFILVGILLAIILVAVFGLRLLWRHE